MDIIRLNLVFARAVMGVLLGLALLAITAMVLQSRFNAHPDEIGHVKAAEYYFNHWVRSPIGSPDLDSAVMKNWGASYAFELDAVYFLAGKLTQNIGIESYLRLRFFNVALFVILMCSALFFFREAPGLAVLLGISPQIWYLFSYFNGDAFPLVVSLLTAVMLVTAADRSSWSFRPMGWRTALLGLLCGLLLLSKTNYLVLVAFFPVVVAIKLAKPSFPWLDRATLRTLSTVYFVTALFAGPVWFYDQAREHFEKSERITAYQEVHADIPFKPSNATTTEGYPTSFLRARGYRYSDLFSRFEWHRKSLMSFFGVYGYMTISAPSLYYKVIVAALLVGLIWLTVSALRSSDERRRIELAACLAFGVLVILQSTYYSWTRGLQPQGRYLMPLLPIALVAFHEPLKRVRPPVLVLVAIIFFGLSLWSFVGVGLRHIAKV